MVALKDTPLTASEINTYGTGYVNMHVTDDTNSEAYQKAYDYGENRGHIGGMAYLSTTACGYDENNNWVTSGCSTSYDSSNVKRVVDGWAEAKFTNSELKTVDGYEARLIMFDELVDNFDYELNSGGTGYVIKSGGNVPSWVYNSNYWYWTMSQWNDSSRNVWYVVSDGSVGYGDVYGGSGAVRPVINVYKSKIS